MRVDVETLIRRHSEASQRKRAELCALIQQARLRDPVREQRVLAALLCEPGALWLCAILVDYEFADPRSAVVFECIRELVADGITPTVENVLQAIQLRETDTKRESWGHLCTTARDNAQWWFLSSFAQSPYFGALNLLEHDARLIRTMADRRRSL